jgi:hypothetical protein
MEWPVIYRADPEWDPAEVLTSTELAVLDILERMGAWAPCGVDEISRRMDQRQGLVQPGDEYPSRNRVFRVRRDVTDALEVLLEHALATHGSLSDLSWYPTRDLTHLPIRPAADREATV